MSTRPTEPGTYWWRDDAREDWEPVTVIRKHLCSVECEFMRTGIADVYSMDIGIFGLRIPDPDEPRAEPSGGLTAEEANHLYRLMVTHAFDTAVSSYRGHPDDPTLESVLSAELARIGFTRLTDAEIAAGLDAYGRAHWAKHEEILDADLSGVVRAKLCGEAGIAAFRLAVAEAREAGK